jgi:hypothetical protein
LKLGLAKLPVPSELFVKLPEPSIKSIIEFSKPDPETGLGTEV